MTHTITLVADVYVSKTEALDALSRALEVSVDDSDPSNAILRLDDGVVLSIEVPKFGEDLPLTLDLSGPDSATVSRVRDQVVDAINRELSWGLALVGDDEPGTVA